MNVVCRRCATEYEFDETLLALRGTTVKCTTCGHVFRVFSPGQSAAPDITEAEWSVRLADGTVTAVETLRDLQRAISDGQFQQRDLISRDGSPWKRMGDILELEPFFVAAVRGPGDFPERTNPSSSGPPTYSSQPAPGAGTSWSSAPRPDSTHSRPSSPNRRQQTIVGIPAVAYPESSTPPRPPESAENEPGTHSSAAPTEAEWRVAPSAQRSTVSRTSSASPAPRSASTPGYLDIDDDLPKLRQVRMPLSPRGAAVMTGLIIAGLTMLVVFLWTRAPALTHEQLATEIARARTEVSSADPQRVELAIAALHDASTRTQIPSEALAIASARSHLVQAEQLRSLTSSSNKKNTEVTGHARAALRELAKIENNTSAPALVMLADAKRLLGDLDAARRGLGRARDVPFSGTADYYRVDALVLRDSGSGDNNAVTAALRAEKLERSPLTLLVAAEALHASGDTTSALRRVQSVLTEAPEHPLASEFRTRWAKPKPTPVAAAPSTADAPSAVADDAASSSSSPHPSPPRQPPRSKSAKTAKTTKTTKTGIAPTASATQPATTKNVDASIVSLAPQSLHKGAEEPPVAATDYGSVIREARASLAGGLYDEARLAFGLALDLHPNSGEALEGLGILARMAGHRQDALNYFRSAIRSGYSEAYYHAGIEYLAQQDTGSAIAAFSSYLRANPRGKYSKLAQTAIDRARTTGRASPTSSAETSNPPSSSTP